MYGYEQSWEPSEPAVLRYSEKYLFRNQDMFFCGTPVTAQTRLGCCQTFIMDFFAKIVNDL